VIGTNDGYGVVGSLVVEDMVSGRRDEAWLSLIILVKVELMAGPFYSKCYGSNCARWVPLTLMRRSFVTRTRNQETPMSQKQERYR